jgi:hypothetical protein
MRCWHDARVVDLKHVREALVELDFRTARGAGAQMLIDRGAFGHRQRAVYIPRQGGAQVLAGAHRGFPGEASVTSSSRSCLRA